MHLGPPLCKRFIAWNGLRISPPKAWQARVAGLCHLVFEEDFRPRLQIRWQKRAEVGNSARDRIVKNLAGPNQAILPADKLPVEWRQTENFRLYAYSDKASATVTGGILFCRRCHTLIHFQVFPDNAQGGREVGDCLATLTCHNEEEVFWRLEDFSFVTPPDFSLTDYTFAAGLTRLSFADGDLSLQTCKLGPADLRLRQQTLEQILRTLTGTGDLVIHRHKTGKALEGSRTPGFGGRLLFRLRRVKPFIKAHIRHDESSNRLLALILSANRPLPGTLLQSLSNRYEII